MATQYWLQVCDSEWKCAQLECSAIPTTAAEAIAEIDQLPGFAHIKRVLCIDDEAGTSRNVTHELWALAEAEWSLTHSVRAGDELPQFIKDHAPASFDTGYRGYAEAAE